MHTPTVITFDLKVKTRRRASSAKDETFPLTFASAEPFGLHFGIGDVGDPAWTGLQAAILPKLNIQVTRFEWRKDVPGGYDYDFYIDVLRVDQTGEVWQVTDLYLDILIYEGRRLTVTDTGEYLEAIAEGKLGRADAEHALSVTHETLNALARNGHSLNLFLKQRGVELPWA